MTLNIRKMTDDDLEAVFAVRTSTLENAITMEELETDYGITIESLARAMQTHVQGWLCEEDGAVVGFSMGDRQNGEVQVVAVHPDHESRGIGKALLEEVKEWLFASGHDEIWLGSNPDKAIRAHGFYRRLGWRATGEMQGYDEILVLGKPTSGV